MAKTMITNVTGEAATLPAPYSGVLASGKSVVAAKTVAEVEADLGSAVGSVFRLTQVAEGTAADVELLDGDEIEDNTIDGSEVAALGATVAATTPGIVVAFSVNIADAATANYDIVTTQKVEVIDVIAEKRGGAGGAANTVQVINGTGANAISDALDLNIADQAIARAASLNDANSTVDAGGTIRLAVTRAGGNAACKVTILAVVRA